MEGGLMEFQLYLGCMENVHLIWVAHLPRYMPSHLMVVAQGMGEEAMQAEHLKHCKNTTLESKYDFLILS